MARKPAKFVMQKQGNRLIAAGDLQQRMYTAFVSGLPDGAVFTVTISEHRQPKSLAQLGYWYGVLMPFAEQEFRAQGYNTLATLEVDLETNSATMDMTFKHLFQHATQSIIVPKKRVMSVDEMSHLIDFTVTYLAKKLGVCAPQPEHDICLTSTK
ncbi:MAG: hypothetical protein GXY83_15535 [Rhodopirellula sp.]|nr:hypothetical protein [Rhodopirellula sp.]